MMENELLHLGAQSLRKAAQDEDAKSYLLRHPELYELLKKAANRFIGGEYLPEAVQCIKQLNAKGFDTTTDFMGESIRDKDTAIEACQEFTSLATSILNEQLSSSISLDLSHIGLLISKDLVKEHLATICEAAQQADKEVIISMEASDRTDDILDIYVEMLKSYPNLGITLQAYLYRTIEDFQDMIRLPGSIRMVKGAYEEESGISIARGSQLDETYLGFIDTLLAHDHPCSIASHDEVILKESLSLIEQHAPTQYCFERLLGIRNEELELPLQVGHPCRIYVVYGKEWYLYLCNRLAEYPLHIFQAISDMVK